MVSTSKGRLRGWKSGLHTWPRRANRPTGSTRKKALKRSGGVCAACGEDFSRIAQCLEVHHAVPLRDGGSNDQENLVVLCSACHGRKHGRRP